jgi:hypothetical protein
VGGTIGTDSVSNTDFGLSAGLGLAYKLKVSDYRIELTGDLTQVEKDITHLSVGVNYLF